MKRRTALKLLGAGSVGTAIVGIPTSIPTPALETVEALIPWSEPIEAVVAWKRGWLYFTADGVFEVVDDEIIRDVREGWR